MNKEVIEISGLKRSTIYNYISLGIFPSQIKLGKRCAAWVESEISEVNFARIAERTEQIKHPAARGGELNPKRLNSDERKLNAEVLELKAKISNLQIIINANLPGTSENIEDLSKSNILLAEKEAQLNETKDKIADVKTALSKPISEGFMRYLLTDANGISFHRFQML